jgi:hypothetical protein
MDGAYGAEAPRCVGRPLGTIEDSDRGASTRIMRDAYDPSRRTLTVGTASSSSVFSSPTSPSTTLGSVPVAA